MTGVDIFETFVAAVCSANLAVFAITWVHELIAMLKAKNHECSIEINALNARIAELKEKLLKGGNNDYE